MADDYRLRCADAAMNAWYMNAVLCDHSQNIPFGNLVDAVLAVRDQDAETLRSDNEELRKRAELAEAAIVRVREDHGESAYMPGYCFCANPYPCPTVRALDGEDTGRG